MLFRLAFAAVVAAISGSAQAQVTQSYTYDANGRLTGVSTAGAAGTNTAAYVYDDADNRTLRGQSGSSAYALLLELPADQMLRPDQALASADHRYTLALRPSGLLELWLDDAPVAGAPLDEAFRVDPATGAAFAIPVARSAVLRLSNDGRLTAANGENVLWALSDAASTLETGGDQ